MSEVIIPIPEKPKKSISFSEYSTYLTCQHKWYLNYYLRLPGDVSEELIFGSALHNTIENIFTSKHILRFYRLNREKTIQDIFSGCLKDELARVTDLSFLKNFSEKKLAGFFMWQAKELILKLNFEKKFKDYDIHKVELKLDGLPIHEEDDFIITYKGFIDLVFQHKTTGRFLIVDWKSSRKPWDIQKKMKESDNLFAQLCLYKHFFSYVKGIDMDLIDTKYYNFPRAEPDKQSFYAGILNKKYVEAFLQGFTDTSIKIYHHSKSLSEFSKAKHTTPKNWCNRCKFNTPELCNDVDEFQTLPHLFPPPPKHK